MDHPSDADFLNVPIANYDQMDAIFSIGQTTRREEEEHQGRASKQSKPTTSLPPDRPRHYLPPHLEGNHGHYL
ncbi:hypothetical protein GUJ93_ZPchr0005g14393 [Zizania palustris]|uniref:Uncharacterized protein n=1 Tax=Zizania palustris TaxID=103762 RepID=A0A8J5T9S6_ZIZPA|nr:hypothetical protein GUJ93_ZPchr0005g14393 [Zizania palustris]